MAAIAAAGATGNRWTHGCAALGADSFDELYSSTPPGTGINTTVEGLVQVWVLGWWTSHAKICLDIDDHTKPTNRPEQPDMAALTRTHLAAVVVALVAGITLLTGCGADEKPADELACDLIDPAVVDQVAEGREWHAVGSLYFDGRFSDGCTILSLGEQLLTITLIDFHPPNYQEPARSMVLGEATHLAKDCPQTTQAPASADQATSQCVYEDKIRYAVMNPKRLVRVTLHRLPESVPTTAAVAKVAASINKNADKIGQ